MRWTVLCSALLALLAGCGSQPTRAKLDWAKAPGGGTVAFTSPTGSSSLAVRCIPLGQEEICLIANEIDGISMTFQVVDRRDLNESDLWTNKDGYQCMYLAGLSTSQQIMKGGRTIMSATAPSIGDGRLPPKSETVDYMRLNVPNATAKYFDCAKVAKMFSRGSLTTAATTSVTPELLGFAS